MAGYCLIEIKRGETLYREFEFFESDEITLLDISTFNITGVVKTAPNSGAVTILTTSIKDGTVNTLILELTGAQVESMPTTGKNFLEKEDYLWDVKADTGSAVEYLLEGPFVVIPRATV